MIKHREKVQYAPPKENYPYRQVNQAYLHHNRDDEHAEIERLTQEFLANKKNKINYIPKRDDEETMQAFLDRKAVVAPGVYGR